MKSACKTICLIGFLFCFCQLLNAQNTRACGDQRTVMLYENNIWFSAFDEESNVIGPSGLMIGTFEMDGLKMSSYQFNSFHLREKDITEGTAYFNYDNSGLDTSRGVFGVYFRFNVKVPIVLNGSQLMYSGKRWQLSKIDPSDIKSIIYQKRFLRKNRLLIETTRVTD